MVQTLPRDSRWRRVEVSPAVEGKLTMEEGSLMFRPENGEEEPAIVLMADVEKVKRPAGSAVIELRLHGRDRVVWFYFVKPPPRLPRGAGRGLRQYVASRGSGQLGMANALWGDEVTSWYERIRESVVGS
jgi:hypothetical protein